MTTPVVKFAVQLRPENLAFSILNAVAVYATCIRFTGSIAPCIRLGQRKGRRPGV